MARKPREPFCKSFGEAVAFGFANIASRWPEENGTLYRWSQRKHVVAFRDETLASEAYGRLVRIASGK